MSYQTGWSLSGVAALLLAVVLAPTATAEAGGPPTQTVASNGVTLRVPSNWRIVPYGEGYAACPSSEPVLQVDVPSRPAPSFCPAIPTTQATSVASVGSIEYPQAYAGLRQLINGIPARVAMNQSATALEVQAFFPTLDTEIALSFIGPGAVDHAKEARTIIQSATPARWPSYGLVLPPTGLRTRLSLDRERILPGEELHATLIVTNTTRATLNLTKVSPSGCQPRAALALMSPTWLAPEVAFAASCIGAPTLIPPGITRWPIIGFATYDPCGVRAEWSLPSTSCANGGPTAIPRGQYLAVLVGQDLPLPPPRALPVTAD